MKTIIKTTRLTKSYSAKGPVVLDIPSLEIQEGEFFGLLGPNGAGKTTFISILSGMLPPSGGQVHIFNQDVLHHPASIQQRIGLVPQQTALYESLTARENLALFSRLYGLSRKQRMARIDYCLELTGLSEHANRRIATFSGGMKRLINFCIGIIHEPDLLILDEPTLGIDTQARHALLSMISTLNRENMTIIYTTHYIEDAERLCSRIAMINRGRVVCQGTPEELLGQHPDSETLEYLFLRVTAP